jgi:hypothetical protein
MIAGIDELHVQELEGEHTDRACRIPAKYSQRVGLLCGGNKANADKEKNQQTET